ncbi:hypothetical protein MIR68_004093 [Amoeboaphelidium protococcarum]|nr:hypothetical protein MIR68_004093 [Amoeboaphelidium protococcarum]
MSQSFLKLLNKDCQYIIKDVWAENLEEEMKNIAQIVQDYPYVAMDTEFPGVVARPLGNFKTAQDYLYQTLRCNVDLLNLIQLGLTFADEQGRLPPTVCTWQFNFKFNLAEDMYANDSIELLQKSGIDFQKFSVDGISQQQMSQNKKIRLIDQKDAHSISVTQTISSLANAVKEVVENSLDANSSVIEATFYNYGLDGVKVSDNGSGIAEDQFAALVALRNHTSKIDSLQQLAESDSFGFRGEGLNALCFMSDVEIVTRHSTSSTGFQLTFDHSGGIERQAVQSRDQGTTVQISNLFASLPVRRQEFIRNHKKEYAKCVSLLTEYGLVMSNRTKLCVKHQLQKAGSNNAEKVLLCSGESLMANATAVYGIKFANTLRPLSGFSLTGDGDIAQCQVDGLMSAGGQGRSSADRQYLYINRRPVHLPKITRLLNEVWKSQYPQSYPCYVLTFTVPANSYDVNVTPDKRQILLHNEQQIMQWLRDVVSEWINSNSGSIQRQVLSQQTQLFPSQSSESKTSSLSSLSSSMASLQSQPQSSSQSQSLSMKEDQSQVKLKVLSDVNLLLPDSNKKFHVHNVNEYLKIDLNDIESGLIEKLQQEEDDYINSDQVSSQTLDIEGERAEEQTAVRLSKLQFQDMQVVGQFNLAFIIAKLQSESGMDYFVVDQHASDEKTRFEMYMQNLRIQCQPLVNPLTVHLTPNQVQIVMENEQLFKSNGFIVSTAPGDSSAICIKSLPTLNGRTYTQSDFEELLLQLTDSDGHHCHGDSGDRCCSKTRAVLASKACRSAIMVGDTLSANKMQQVVSGLSKLDHPWCCPHGRPTIRWLYSSQTNQSSQSQP